MQLIDNFNFAGKKAIVRVDFNVPLNKETGAVSDDTRIRGALPTIKKIIADGGSAILMSHMGRPKQNPDPKFSLKQIVSAIESNLGMKIQFVDDCMKADAAVAALKPGEVLLLENLRFYEEEEGKPRGEFANDDEKAAAKKALKDKQKEFAKKLASYANVYVNDAFGTAHRAHGSTAVIADYFDENSKMFGFLINSELKAMDSVLNEAKAPFTAIMGGAKVSDKIMIIENLLNRVQNLIIGGGMTYTFIKALGGKIGNSLCEEDKMDLALDILNKAKEKGVKVYLPTDAVNADAFDANANTCVSKTNETPDGWMGLDIADESIKTFDEVIANSKTVLWNGPMGVFEMDKFAKGTTAVAHAVAKATSNGAFTLIGGGDSVAAINKNKLADKVSYVSTGGGAMLEYMEGKVLPGIKAIRGK
ncbi:MAG TPA: phosphoglycerate kinase [Paludibacteraceae bacterium]|nr:phosphoglycerate kinase [Paludibacteraceae bacterium]HPH63608.1 phosphoglycerate kinase [Paludibacteraceae bacterium]HQF50056.1 phosphoglycerate kinase [Paludibacteraceae bacterium]HQJ89538.1 phosphoglycerate kinase [Paludibacteraceae bacterium]